MPQRHSKNNNDSAVFSRHEREAAGYGSVTMRVGSDSQLPFGYCALTLKPVVDPVVSPSGHLYSREAIIEYLLTKTQELKKQRAIYEAQQQEREEDALREAAAEQEDKARAFIEKQTSATAAVAASRSVTGPKKSEQQERREKFLEQHHSKMIVVDKEDRREDLKRTSFWLPQCAPEVKDAGVDKPDKRPRSPMTGEPLRAKDLLPISITVDPEWSDAKAAEGRGKFICAVSRNAITSQPAVLLKNTGVVLLEKVAQELAMPTMTCPVTGKPFKESDVLRIQSGGTGFAASGKVEVKKYRPTRF